MDPSSYAPYSRPQFLPEELRPVGDRVLIRHLQHDEKIGSLFVPETAREGAHRTQYQGYTFRGEVVAVGDGCHYTERVKKVNGRPEWVKKFCAVPIKPEVQPGDIVLFERRREAEVEFDGQMFSLVHDVQSIHAVVEGAA